MVFVSKVKIGRPEKLAAPAFQEALRKLEMGVSVARLCRDLKISRPTFYRYKKLFELKGEIK